MVEKGGEIMKKIICIICLSFLLTGCSQVSVDFSYSQNEIILKGSSEDKKYYETNTFYQEDLKNKIVDIVNEIEYSSKESKDVAENSDFISVVMDNQEVTFYEDGHIFINESLHKSSNGEEVYTKLELLLHDLSYEAYSYIYKRNNEEYIIDTNLLFDQNSSIGTFDAYRKSLPLSYPLENVTLTEEEVVQYQDKEQVSKANIFQEEDSSVLAVIYTGEPRNVQKEVENANITISYIKNNTVSVKKSISLQQRCTLVIE